MRQRALSLIGVTVVALTAPLLQTPLASAATFAAISAGGFAGSCGVVGEAAKCWGYNGSGQLGDGTSMSSNAPVNVKGLSTGVVAVASSGSHSCALTTDGAVKCWGDNVLGELGDGTNNNSNVPVQVFGLSSGVSAITVGFANTCALASGLARCWGNNFDGQLGDGSETNSNVPVPVAGLGAGVSAISSGGNHTCAIVSGTAQCWGANFVGQLGNGTETNSTVPVPVSGLGSGVTEISSGGGYTCAVVSGAAECWGANFFGQLGNGTQTTSTVPVPVAGLGAGVTAISSGSYHTCAIVSGAAECWGFNSNGQLGNGTQTTSTVPVPVTGLGAGVTAISTSGFYHTCAIVFGAAECWGLNSYGQLGNGTTTDSSVPVDVLAESQLDRVGLVVYWGPKNARVLAFSNSGPPTAGGFTVSPSSGSPDSIVGTVTIPSIASGTADVTFNITYDSGTEHWSGTAVITDVGIDFSATIPVTSGRFGIARRGTVTSGTLWGIKAQSVPQKCFKIVFQIDDLI